MDLLLVSTERSREDSSRSNKSSCNNNSSSLPTPQLSRLLPKQPLHKDLELTSEQKSHTKKIFNRKEA